ncbi:OmcA/MtrC family decaheme c-type cytochrome [Rhodoferax sp. GW822-FHT02A01]|uniref:OmcA/MtrC family decaheme c-type cytochrome n=1 Tax=Rhodoferax sp. GW822-FHT02A01 TaxID=3141537 RepID=UPI00315CC319
MKRTFFGSSLLALISATLISCGGGGSDGVATSSSSTSGTAPVTTSGTTNAAALSTAAMANLSISGSVQGVTIHSPPVITFQLVNSDNNTALTGVDQLWVKRTDVKTGAVASPAGSGTTDSVPFYPNLSFAIAKYVPGSNGSPGKWVSYMVSTPTLDSTGKATAYTPGAPGTENNGTLEYLGNGQYKYTFRRDITQVAQQVASSTAPNGTTQQIADLGDLTYDPNALHRLVIQVSSVVRGSKSSSTSSSASTYCHTNNGICPDGYANTSYDQIRTPVDLVFDWIPATGRVITASDTDVEQREIVNVAACASCHNKFTFHGGNELKGWGGGRQEARQCVVCHTDQRKYGSAGTAATQYAADGLTFTSATTPTINGLDASDRHSNLDFPVFIHKIHMGEELRRSGYSVGGVALNDTKYPQLITNCAKCHSGDTTKPDGTANTVTKIDGTVVQMATPQGNNWNTKPSRLACGACHDIINYNTGAGHGANGVGGAQPNDSMCSSCHNSVAIKKVHVAVTPQDTASSMFANCASAGTCNGNTNAAWLASNPNNLPDGAVKVTYDISSVSRNSSKQPVMVFRMLQNGARVDFNAKPAPGTPNSTLSGLEMWDGFMGSPSVYFVFARPQDGVTAPADFNGSSSKYLRSIWNGKDTGATMTGPDANGYYTVTFTGVTLNDDATMLTGGLGYTYAPATTMPLTQTNLTNYPITPATANGQNGSVTLTAGMPNKTGGLIVVAPDVQVVGTGYTGRRQIVEDKRCNNCHQELGAFNTSQFHAGQRNDGTTCSWCHNPNRTSSGWSADSTNFVHGIHGSAKRKNSFTWHAASTTDGFWTIGYPGVLKNCEACHVPGSYDYSANGRLTVAANKTYRYTAVSPNNDTSTFSSSASALTKFAYSPYIVQDTNYGVGFSTSTNNGSTAAASTNLVESPTATVCFACHDDCDRTKDGTTYTAANGTTATYSCPVPTDSTKTYARNANLNAYARDHMLANGGVLYAPRGSNATPNAAGTETCFTCHGPNSAANIKAAHSK